MHEVESGRERKGENNTMVVGVDVPTDNAYRKFMSIPHKYCSKKE